MKLKPVFAMSCVVAAFAASPSLAGSPDDPGAGGQRVKAMVEWARETGTTFGAQTSYYVHDSDGTNGADVSPLNAPNPGSDSGGGND